MSARHRAIMQADRNAAVDMILAARRTTPPAHATLVALSGIDGAGKGYVTGRLVQTLQACGVAAVAITIDGWLNLPHVRFNDDNPAEHFYRHGIRFDEMFSRLVLPLRDRRSVRLEMDYTEEAALTSRRHVVAYDDVDVILLEGIYLLKREWQDRYDAAFWIDCTFDTALERAIARSQEGLSPADTIAAYRRIYFPAQEIHHERDRPRAAATAIITNDPRLGETWGRS